LLTDINLESSVVATSLFEVAFGGDPGRWPLPAAQSPAELWLRSVAAAGQGRYGSARADLAALRRRQPTGALASLALSAQASFLRQLGWHRLARGWDGRALAVVLAGPAEPLSIEATVDALIGLAADALGIGRFAVSARLLERAAEALPGASDSPRLSVRMAWVSAELAMVSGDGHAAVQHAERGVELAELMSPASRRHRIKSDVVLAAALCSAGSFSRSREVADAALAATVRHGVTPLRWALACLLADIGSAEHTSQVLVDIRAESAGIITRHGGQWCGG